MDQIRAVIVDDEPIARRGIRLELAHDKDVVVVGECRNASQAVTFIRKESPDLVFLDIQMPKRDGFSVVEELALGDYPVIVFVTAYDEHALRAFDANAVDYVLKPINPHRFRRALQKAKKAIGRHRLTLREKPRKRAKQFLSRLIVRSHNQIDFVNVDDVALIESADNYVHIHAGSARYLYRDTVKNLEKHLDPADFVRIRRSTIVNIQSILRLRRSPNGEFRLELKSGYECVTSRRFRRNLRRLLTSHKDLF